ncbi:MAG: hypothetical protein AB198_01075 [Parcubacteria bacterium C7867-003]|nr:MAG: hypothetical protein AB198_01075 [Parcubacteria bacterium C7867-003]
MTNYKNPTRGEGILIQDIAIIFFSVLIAFVLIKTRVISDLLLSTEKFEFVGAFVAGMFFTTIFTTAPAIVTLGNIALHTSLLTTALFGAVGAMIGDLIIFRFIRDRLSEHLFDLISHNTVWKRTKHLFKLRYFRWFTFLIGGLLIASPLPDELGIGLLGFTKMKTRQFIPVSLFFNFIGILLIGIVARSI